MNKIKKKEIGRQEIQKRCGNRSSQRIIMENTGF
jgi:hypothetical protein